MFNSKTEFVQAMMEGRKFKFGHNVMYFDKDCTLSPFRSLSNSGNTSSCMRVEWDLYNHVEEVIEPKWYDNIPKNGVLCWVWNENVKYRKVSLVVKYNPYAESCSFLGSGTTWMNAEPMTKEEVLQYILDK